MIVFTKYDGRSVGINMDLIKSVEETPDTLISLVSGEKLMVKEGFEDVVKKFESYRKKVFARDYVQKE